MSGTTLLFLSSSFNLKQQQPRNINTTNIKQQQHPRTIKSFSFTSQTPAAISHFDAVTQTPTPPWVKKDSIFIENEDLIQQELLVRIEPSTNTKTSSDGTKSDRALTEKVSGGRGKKAMKLILQGIDKLHKNSNISPLQLQKHLCEEEDANYNEVQHFQFRGTLLEDIINVNNGDVVSASNTTTSSSRRRMPWTKDEKMVFRRVKKERLPTKADLSLDKMLLERLRKEAPRIRNWVKVKKMGVCQSVVDQIRYIWSTNELVMVKFDLPLCRNMDRAHEIAELKTGGLVIWSKKDTLVIYRGHSYPKTLSDVHQRKPSSILNVPKVEDNITFPQVSTDKGVPDEKLMKHDEEKEFRPCSIFIDDIKGSEPLNVSLYEREANRLLDGLGPRFVDWWMPKPLPVDADKLPEIVPGYEPPRRLAPLNGTSKLTNVELAYLRKDAQHLPTHFVLGRNRMLQGLALAILKLWEKSYIAKIAIKWGVMNTSNEDMAFELKRLTGGVLLLRNKFFIILYRGKDFLPCGAADLIAERDTELKIQYLHEEDARLKAAESLCGTTQMEEHASSIGTLSEFQSIQTDFADERNVHRMTTIHLEAEKENVERELRIQEHKLFILQAKIKKSAKELSKLNSKWDPSENETDKELITQEERECLRKIAMKRSSTLVLGRRGVFDGVMEAVYQHWKHREVVKVITMQKAFTQVMHTANFLETESGGILISIEKLKEGHAILLYRGKNFTRPSKDTTTMNLLSKRQALQRSLELQRIGSLKYIAYQRQLAISDMKLKIEDLQNRIEAASEDFNFTNHRIRGEELRALVKLSPCYSRFFRLP